jgi:hypothetical protein
MKKFKVTSEFKGYVSKKDITNLDEKYLVSPSKNTYINDGEKISSRPGYTILGASNTATTPIESAFTWYCSTGIELPMRSYDDELEFWDGDTWVRLANSWSSVNFQYATWWDATEKLDRLILVNGDSNLYSWNGATALISSTTSNSITKTGTTTFAEDRFFTTGNKTVLINGTEYAYTGGEGTTTLTGVTPDPTGEANGSMIIQKIVTTSNKPASGFKNDVIGVLNNQLYVGDSTKRQIYISKNNDFTTFTYSSPRVPGEGALITPDSPPVAFLSLEDKMYASCGRDEWYKITFTLSADLTKETVEIKRLDTAPLQGAISANGSAKIKNDVVFVTNEPTIDSLGRIENVEGVRSVPLSDSISVDMDGYDFTNSPSIIYYKNQIFCAIPSSGVVLIYDLQEKFWQPPWYMPISHFSIIGGELIGHSSQVAESYKLFDGNNDNGNPIDASVSFAYYSGGERGLLKSMNEYFSEGYISLNTTLTMVLKYDFGGYGGSVTKDIKGTDSGIIFQTTTDNSLGKQPLGSQPLGSVTDSLLDLPKFRVFHELTKNDWYEYQVVYGSNQVDAQWELLAHGGNVYLSSSGSNDRKR